MTLPEPPDWEELSEQYPLAGALGAPDSKSIQPPNWTKRILIGFGIIAVIVTIIFHP
jgi:hypothetical protein